MMTGGIPRRVKIVEVSPRDGLQNLPVSIPTAGKIELIRKLVNAGVRHIEATSFVSPKWVPQMADAEAVIAGAHDFEDGLKLSVLTPNTKGLQRAVGCGVQEVAFFLAATESFSQKNTHCSIAESLVRAEALIDSALEQGVAVRGYVSCVLGCPYEGEVEPEQVALLSRKLLEFGCYEVSLGDTIGIGTPASLGRLLDVVLSETPVERLALHCHDTRGQALANLLKGLSMGVSVIDSSVAGLGGCPYAPGASGNVATEDVLYMLQGYGIETGIDLPELARVGQAFVEQFGLPNRSRVGRVMSRPADY